MPGRYGFIHIPKTAGRAFVSALILAAPEDTIHVAGVFEMANFPEIFDQCRILGGHIPRFMYEWMQPPRQLVTILRDPVERVLSAYRFANTSDSHPAHRFMCACRPTIVQCLQHPSLRHEYSNFQTKMLGINASVALDWPPRGLAAAKIFASSLLEVQHLPTNFDMLPRAMMFVDTGRVRAVCLEDTPSVLALASDMAGTPVQELPRINQTVPVEWRPTNEETDLIRAANRLDIALYEFTRKLADKATLPPQTTP